MRAPRYRRRAVRLSALPLVRATKRRPPPLSGLMRVMMAHVRVQVRAMEVIQ